MIIKSKLIPLSLTLAALIAGTSMCATPKNEIKKTDLIINSSISESKTLKSELFRGINRGYLETYIDLKKSPDYSAYLKKIEDIEKNINFLSLEEKCEENSLEKEGQTIKNIKEMVDGDYNPKCEGAEYLEKIYSAAIKNTSIIRAIDKIPIEQLNDEFKSLKYLLGELAEIDKAYSNPSRKLEQMYNDISFRYKSIRGILNENSSSPDKIPAIYFSFLNYFNIKCYFKNGKNGKEIHTWISVDINKNKIDLDPGLYPKFVPLKDTNIEKIIFKAKYMDNKFINKSIGSLYN